MRRPPLLFFLLALILSLSAVAVAEPPAPGKNDKCPVCGMFVTRHPDWMAIAELNDHPPLFLCGPKDLFKFIHFPGKYLPQTARQKIEAVHVKDYYSLSFIDGRQAVYVPGSDLLGPMGNELIPFKSRDEAAEFMRDHGGRPPVTFGEVTPQALLELD
ncbi:MAG: nitrous oxide reductase accessory protein NosL [Desulfuromonadales bacterium]|nr:nitrous oxide reductase accessory protein NosL [Desulfuromonadales bacterium]